jgi:hypothetical protein
MPAAQRCYFASSPAGRPCCEVTAVLRRGNIALCASCDASRSSLAKGQPATRLPAGPPVDPLDWIADARAQLHDAEAELAAAAARARQHGHSRAAIGTRMGITRQAAQQRFGSPQTARSGNHDHHDKIARIRQRIVQATVLPAC